MGASVGGIVDLVVDQDPVVQCVGHIDPPIAIGGEVAWRVHLGIGGTFDDRAEIRLAENLGGGDAVVGSSGKRSAAGELEEQHPRLSNTSETARPLVPTMANP